MRRIHSLKVGETSAWAVKMAARSMATMRSWDMRNTSCEVGTSQHTSGDPAKPLTAVRRSTTPRTELAGSADDLVVGPPERRQRSAPHSRSRFDTAKRIASPARRSQYPDGDPDGRSNKGRSGLQPADTTMRAAADYTVEHRPDRKPPKVGLRLIAPQRVDCLMVPIRRRVGFAARYAVPV
jgi:hypothetical protein